MPKYEFTITITECVDRETTIEVAASNLVEAYQAAEKEIVSNLHDADWQTRNNTVKISDFQIDLSKKTIDESGDKNGDKQYNSQ